MIFSENLSIIGGMLTHIPKLCVAPKLKDIRFAYQPLASIEPNAFKHLPSLESLDLAGNGAEPTMRVLQTDALSMSAVNFSSLEMGYFKSLESFSPNFISNIQPNAYLNFLNGSVDTISEEVFRQMFETMLTLPDHGHVSFGRNPLKCDCSIAWLVLEPRLLAVVDWEGAASFDRPICRDGTPLADLDPAIFGELCP